MSKDSRDPLMSRAVSEETRPRALTIRCPNKAAQCEGTVYTLKPGEHLSRRARSGWLTEKRSCVCDRCGTRQTVSVQVRAA